MLVQGLACSGSFTHLGRFRTQPDRGGVPLSELAEVALESWGRTRRRRRDRRGNGGAGRHLPEAVSRASRARPPFNYVPALEEWLAFTPEPAFARMTTVVAGVVARAPGAPLAEFLRPMGGTQGLQGHFHAVVFPHNPLPQRTVGLQSLVLRLFGSLKIRSILHLLADDRGAQGVGESGFLRGLCWISPIKSVTGPAREPPHRRAHLRPHRGRSWPWGVSYLPPVRDGRPDRRGGVRPGGGGRRSAAGGRDQPTARDDFAGGLAGAAAGVVTGLLHTRLGVPRLLAGILPARRSTR